MKDYRDNLVRPAPPEVYGAAGPTVPQAARAGRPARPARLRPRHYGLILSFLMLVMTPVAGAAWYLWTVALPQYASHVGFSVQREETGSAIEILGGITELSGSGSEDTDILYQFIRGRQMVEALQARLDLVAIYRRPGDPLFSIPADPVIEDIEAHWGRNVDVFYDTASRLIEVRVLAFTPEDALRLSQGIYDESTRMLNALTDSARADATRYAREELNLAQARLKAARQALTAFRVESQIVDPAADVQGRMGLLNTLLAQQAMALIDLDMLAANAGANDQRYLQAQKRVEVIETRIRAERARFGEAPAAEDRRYADLVAAFEALTVDLEFAEKSYLSALATHDAAVAEAQRKSRYLATYVQPTLAERSDYPQRWMILALVSGFLFACWAIVVLVFYALRDRR